MPGIGQTRSLTVPNLSKIGSSGRLPRQIELFRGSDVVQPPDRHCMRCGAQFLGILFHFLPNRRHCVTKTIKFLLGFGFGRLDQQAFRHQQREIRGRRVKSKIQQPLGDVHRRDLKAPVLVASG